MIPGAALNLDCPVNWSHPLNRGRVAWYLAHPSIPRGNTWHELCGMSSKRAYDGTLTNGPMWKGNCGRPGGYGSLSFDGVNDVVSTAITVDPGASSFAVGFWFNTATSAGTQVILCKGNEGAANAGFSFNLAGGVLTWRARGSSAAVSVTSAVSTNTWYHACGVIDRANTLSRLYINGLQVSSGSTASIGATVSSGAILQYGRRGPTNNDFPYLGLLDDVFYYPDTLLSATNVFALHQQSRLGHPETLNWI
jgi:hypothetical protein